MRQASPSDSTVTLSRLATGQAVYFLLTGIWPLLSIRTFQMVTGRKTDTWLVKTVGVLVAVLVGVGDEPASAR